MPHVGRLFMKQFLLKQTMDDVDEAASGGSYFIDIASWIPDLNHILIANQPSAPPFSSLLFLSTLLSYFLLSLYLSFFFVSRNYSQVQPPGNSENLNRFLPKAFIAHLSGCICLQPFHVIACSNIPLASSRCFITRWLRSTIFHSFLRCIGSNKGLSCFGNQSTRRTEWNILVSWLKWI